MKTILLSLFLFFSVCSFGQKFNEPIVMDLAYDSAKDLHFEDLNGDGEKETYLLSDSELILLNYINGEYSESIIFTMEENFPFNSFGDIDGDGDIDLISKSQNFGW